MLIIALCVRPVVLLVTQQPHDPLFPATVVVQYAAVIQFTARSAVRIVAFIRVHGSPANSRIIERVGLKTTALVLVTLFYLFALYNMA